MGWFSWIAERVPRKMAIAMMTIGSLFGMRTPPEPPVTAQTAPSPRWDEGMPPERASKRSGEPGDG